MTTQTHKIEKESGQKLGFPSPKTSLFAKKDTPTLQKRLVCKPNKACFGSRKRLNAQQTRLVFHILHAFPNTHRRPHQTETTQTQCITPNRPFLNKTIQDSSSCLTLLFSAITNLRFSTNIRQEIVHKTTRLAPYAHILCAQMKQKAEQKPKASVIFSYQGIGFTQSFSYFSIGYSKFFHNFAEIICTK